MVKKNYGKILLGRWMVCCERERESEKERARERET
jgi:hypothetical protein